PRGHPSMCRFLKMLSALFELYIQFFNFTVFELFKAFPKLLKVISYDRLDENIIQVSVLQYPCQQADLPLSRLIFVEHNELLAFHHTRITPKSTLLFSNGKAALFNQLFKF